MHSTPHHTVRQAKKSTSNDAGTNAHLGNAVIARKAFEDNRPESIAQRQIQSDIQNSTQVQAAAQLQAKANLSTTANPTVQQHKNETGMPDQLKAGIEGMSGMDMSDVRVHHGSDKPAQVQAHAYAQGNDIHLGPGQEQHLPHEAWHVVQQRQGRVQPTKQLKGKVAVNDDAGLEHEADVMGAKAMQMKSSNATANDGLQQGSAQQGNGPVQRMTNEGIEVDKPMNKEEIKQIATGAGASFFSDQPCTCGEKTKKFFDDLQFRIRPKENLGAIVLLWIAKDGEGHIAAKNHTAVTCKIEGEVYVIDTTIDQFGSSHTVYFGTMADWKNEVLSLCGSRSTILENNNGKIRRGPIDDSKFNDMTEDYESDYFEKNPKEIKTEPQIEVSKPEPKIEVSKLESKEGGVKPTNPSKKKSCEIL
jgi:hypothetical protein